jgi:gluconolactonase
MRVSFICSALLFVSISNFMNHASVAASENSPRTIGKIERFDPALGKLVPPDAKMHVVGEGFAWCEGPAWIRSDSPPSRRGGASGGGEPATSNSAPIGYLLFSDIPNNAIMKWDPSVGVTLYLKPAGYTGASPRGGESGSNGLTTDRDGRLVLCQHGDRRVALLELTPERQKPNFVTLADRYEGKRFNSPNDAVVHSSGAIYFTDPPYGLEKNMDDPAKELDFQGVYHIAPDGKVTLLTKALERPNGIALSPDEKTLYIANSHGPRPVIMAFPVKADGTLGEGREFFNAKDLAGNRPGACDGMTVDEQGNVFATTPGGVTILAPDGKPLGMLATGNRTSNCEFGEDGSTLFITADDLLLRVTLSTKGIGFD